MPTSEQRRYVKKLNEIMERFLRLEDRTLRQMVEALQNLRRGIAADLTEVGGFEAYHLQQLQDSVERLIAQFDAQLTGELRTSLGEAYTLGGQGVVEPLETAGIEGIFHQINAAQLNAVMDFSADLIQNISTPMRAKINTQLRLAVLGQKSPFKTMEEITRILGVKATDLRWGLLRRPEVVKGVAARAEAILRTEMTRVYNLGHFSQQMSTAQRIEGVLKRWMATGDARTRDSHLVAHVRYMKDPIPVDQPFQVGGAKLMYPGDPAGPPEETINCRCRSVTIHVEIGVVGTPMDLLVDRERQQRKQKKAA